MPLFITTLTKIKLILVLREKVSSSKINFSKSHTLWVVAYKKKLIIQGKQPSDSFQQNSWGYILILPMILLSNPFIKFTKSFYQILLSNLWYVGQIYTIPKCIWKKTEKKENLLWSNKK